MVHVRETLGYVQYPVIYTADIQSDAMGKI